VGGDRFAGNVVVFPHGLYYGHVEPEEAAEIVRASELGEVWLKRYRGRSCHGRAVQAAEYFVRAESGRMGMDEFRLLELAQSGVAARVRFRAQSDSSVHTVELVLREYEEPRLLTCSAARPSPVRRYELMRYVMIRI
jgi:hypothetical protein